MTLQHRLKVMLVHLLADFVSDPPCGLIGHPKLALQFFAGNAVACRDKQVDRVKPNLERRACVLKDRASRGVDMITAGSAGKRTAVAHAVERAFDAAGPADVTRSETDVEDMLKASFIIGEPLEKIADAKVWR